MVLRAPAIAETESPFKKRQPPFSGKVWFRKLKPLFIFSTSGSLKKRHQERKRQIRKRTCFDTGGRELLTATILTRRFKAASSRERGHFFSGKEVSKTPCPEKGSTRRGRRGLE